MHGHSVWKQVHGSGWDGTRAGHSIAALDGAARVCSRDHEEPLAEPAYHGRHSTARQHLHPYSGVCPMASAEPGAEPTGGPPPYPSGRPFSRCPLLPASGPNFAPEGRPRLRTPDSHLTRRVPHTHHLLLEIFSLNEFLPKICKSHIQKDLYPE